MATKRRQSVAEIEATDLPADVSPASGFPARRLRFYGGAEVKGSGDAVAESAFDDAFFERPVRENASTYVAPQYRYDAYRSVIDRTVEVFGDPLKASRWLSMPSADLDGQIPLHVAREDGYSLARLEPIFIKLEHGIDF